MSSTLAGLIIGVFSRGSSEMDDNGFVMLVSIIMVVSKIVSFVLGEKYSVFELMGSLVYMRAIIRVMEKIRGRA